MYFALLNNSPKKKSIALVCWNATSSSSLIGMGDLIGELNEGLS